MDRLEIPDHYLRDTSMMSTCHANTVVVCELFWSFSLEKSRNPQKIYVLLLNLAADCLAPLVSRNIHWTFQTLQDAGMESYADDLWQNLLASGQAAEAKDPAELTWWAAGAIDVEAGHNLGNTLATKLLEVRDIGGRKHARDGLGIPMKIKDEWFEPISYYN